MNVGPDSSERPLPKTVRLTETGYRVVAFLDSHDSIEVFADSADGLQRAVQLAKSLCRRARQRFFVRQPSLDGIAGASGRNCL